MWLWIACAVAVVLVAAWMTRINAQYEAREAAAKAGPDVRVQELWEAFGTSDDDAAAMEPRVHALIDEVDTSKLRTKHAVAALAIMAARTGRHEVLEPLARRARSVDGGCGETAALGVLAAAYSGDVELARERTLESQATMAGCASCGASMIAKILMQEVSIALDALESGALHAGASEEESPREEPAPNVLYVRRAG